MKIVIMCCTVLYCTVLYCTVLYCTVLYCTGTVPYRAAVLYSMVTYHCADLEADRIK